MRSLQLYGDRDLRLSEIEPPPPPAAGEVQIRVKAMALNFLEVYGVTPLARASYTALILFILGSEILSYRRTRSWLIDYTDVPPGTIDDALSGQESEVR